VKYLETWTAATPPELAQALVSAIGRPEVRLYPMLTQLPATGTWSLRVEGLEVGRITANGGRLVVGKPGKTGAESTFRKRWTNIAGPAPIVFPSPASLDEAAKVVKEFALDLESHPRKDEHALESRILRGETKVVAKGIELALAIDDPLVSRGSQIPTKWAEDTGRARYLDGLLRDGEIPWAIEMKVEIGGGFASYYRHAIGQAVVYRHFLRTATPMHPWFSALHLDATRCEAAVVFPETPSKVSQKIARLFELAARFDVAIAEVPL
jgi:hypothetical protein